MKKKLTILYLLIFIILLSNAGAIDLPLKTEIEKDFRFFKQALSSRPDLQINKNSDNTVILFLNQLTNDFREKPTEKLAKKYTLL